MSKIELRLILTNVKNMLLVVKCYSEVIKKYFNKELVMTKKDNEDFKNSSKCWICDNTYVDGDVNRITVN